MSVVDSYSQNLEIIGLPTDCKESISSIDYLQYEVLASSSNVVYEWSIEGGADFNPSRTAIGNSVTVRFTEGTETVILRVTERDGKLITQRDISNNG